MFESFPVRSNHFYSVLLFSRVIYSFPFCSNLSKSVKVCQISLFRLALGLGLEESDPSLCKLKWTDCRSTDGCLS